MEKLNITFSHLAQKKIRNNGLALNSYLLEQNIDTNDMYETHSIDKHGNITIFNHIYSDLIIEQFNITISSNEFKVNKKCNLVAA